MVIVVDSCFVPGHMSEWLDSAHEPGIGEHGETVIHRLTRELWQIRSRGLEEHLGGGVGVYVDSS